jgi:serine/threonine-protein kinase
MVWVDRDGRESPAADTGWAVNLSEYGSPPDVGWALSPDGRRLAIGAHSGAGDDIWIKQLPNGPLSRLSFDSAAELRPRWTRDGNSVLFSSVRTGLRQLYRRNADATGSDTLVFSDPRGIFESVLSGDGKTLVLRTGGITGGGGRDISIARLGVDTAPRPLISTPFDEEAIALSPDGKWIAYESDETGRTEVFIRPFPNTDAGKQQVSTNGGGSPLWSRNGRELFYVNGARSMVAVAVGAGDKLQIGEGKTLFHLRDDYYLHKSEYYTPFDISPDGRRFIMARQRVSTGAGVQAQPLVMVTNWFEELKAKTRK